MRNTGGDVDMKLECNQTSVSNETSENNMESSQGSASSQNLNTHHNGKVDPATNLGSASVPAKGEASSIEDIRERFTAIESKINLVDNLFGLQRLAKDAKDATEEDDFDYSSEDSDVNLNIYRFDTDLYYDIVYFMRRVRLSHERVQSYRNKRRNKKMVTVTTKYHLDKAGQKSARQISTTAFLKHEPATINWVDWDLFVVGKGVPEKSLMAPIDAVIGEPEPQLILSLSTRDVQNSNSTARGKFGGIRGPDRGASTEGPGQAPLPERVKIHSGALHSIFTQRLIHEAEFNIAHDGTMVFLRPFRVFIHHEKQLRGYLDELEKRFENWDGTGNPSTKDGDDVTTKDGPNEDRDEKINSPTTDGTGDEKTEKYDKEEKPEETKGLEGPNTEEKINEDEDESGANSVTALLHLRCLMKFIDDEIKPKLEYIESDRCRRILFHDLWHLFKPGNEVVNQSEKQAYRIIRVQIPRHKVEDPWLRWYRKPLSKEDEKEDEKEDGMPVTVHCAYIDFDGKQLGPVSVKFSIPSFGGLKDIKSLPIYPLRFAKDSNLRNSLVTRGKMLLNIAKFKPMYYMGFTLDTRDEIDSQVVVDFSEALADEQRRKWAPIIESLRTAPDERKDDLCRAACCLGQAVFEDEYIDSSLTEDFVKSLIPDASFRAPSLILSPRPLEEAKLGTEDEPTDEELVIMTYRAFGFVLRSRKWAQLDLNSLKYENTDARTSALNAFERLELPSGHREMVKSLVTQHFRDRQAAFAKDDQTDLVRGKGKGLILLLHGAPGVGKTTTAEGVAELFQKPLFQITCGDLGTTARDVEQELEKNFALASRWGCILLLDEADVFLSARERKDFERNGLVAVFLRVLEYYAGILFLTTNRIGDFDEAFASRIHMSLHYPELDELKTKKVFKLNLDLIQERFDRQGRKITYDASSIEDFAEQHFREHPYSRWNGRQIRNACQTALALAEFDAHGGKIQGEVDKSIVVALQLKHFRLVQTAYLDFGRYLGDIRGTQGDRRAIDYGFRAKSNTPYQTTPSRFSAAAATGMRDSRHSSSLSAEHNTNYNKHYPPPGGQASDPFQPLVSQDGTGGGGGGGGYGYGSGGGSNIGHQIYGQYSPQQGQMGPGGGGYDRYESPQGHGYTHPGNQPGQMDSRLYQQSNQQGQNWGGLGPGMNQGYPPAGQNPQGQYPQGQHRQGQPQYGYGNEQDGVGAQNLTMPRPDSTAHTHYSRHGPGSGPEGGGSGPGGLAS
ncbi:hypothetical protein F5Y19DRAFT_489873 [Xylariaceae sp. FL1651]|nr:hypothetical protein F5Y19DRAFT_489873 [Xylariaceae sp. FL1651]